MIILRRSVSTRGRRRAMAVAVIGIVLMGIGAMLVQLPTVKMSAADRLPADWTPLEPAIDPAIERELYNAWEGFRHKGQETASDRERMNQTRKELVSLFSAEVVFFNCVLMIPDLAMSKDDNREFVFFLSFLGSELIPDHRRLCELFGPYWPPRDPELKSILEGEVFGRVTTAPDSPGFAVDFTVMQDLLESAWRSGERKYDGLVDYMFDVQPIMAWLAMLEIEGADERALDELYEELVAVCHPYGESYRTRPERLPPGSREGLHELLVEYSQGDSLWARVFVAEILSKVPYMRAPEIEATLCDDPHWLIQRRMAYLVEDEREVSE